MKKKAGVLISFLIILVFGCNWTIPNGIEVKGKVGINNLSLDFDLSSEISKAIKENISSESNDYSVTVQDCVNVPDIFTLLIHLDIPLGEIIMPKIDILDDIESQVSDWVDDEYESTPTGTYTGGDVGSFLDAKLDEMGDEIVDDEFHWQGRDISITDDSWKGRLKQKIVNNTAGMTDTNEINEKIKDTIRNEAPGEILKTQVIVGEDPNPLVYNDFPSVNMDRMDISDFIDFDKLILDEFLASFYFSVSEKDGGESDFLDENTFLTLKFDEQVIFDDELIIPSVSGIDTTKDEYEGTSIPAGMEVDEFEKISDSLFAKNEAQDRVEINPTLIMKDKVFLLSDFTKEVEVKAELVIWLPLLFKVIEDYNLMLPLDFENDLFGREGEDPFNLEDYIRAAGIEFIFDEQVFSNTKLVINNDNGNTETEEDKLFKKEFPIINKSMKVDFNINDVKNLNNQINYPFTPDISILINPGGEIRIPKELNLAKFSLYADLDLKMDF